MVFKTVTLIFVGVLFLLTVVWLLTFNNLMLSKVFLPRDEAVRRETFEQSKAYNQGMAQEIENMQFQYIQAAPEQKAALRTIILHRVADFDVDLLPPDTAAFVLSLKRGQ